MYDKDSETPVYSEEDFFDKIEDLKLIKDKEDFVVRLTKPHIPEYGAIDILDVGDEERFEKIKPTLLAIAQKIPALLKAVRDFTEERFSGLGYCVGYFVMESDTDFFIDFWESGVNNEFTASFSYKDGTFIFKNFNESVELGTIVGEKDHDF